MTIRRTAIVTGSTSGIGKAIAMRLLRSEFNVVLNYATNKERAADALSACREIGSNVLLQRADVSNLAAATSLIDCAMEEFGTIDVLVNNAARVVDRSVLEMTENEWDQVVDINLKGSFLCSQQAARQMMKQEDGGVILNIGASTGIRGRRNGANTCASKAGLMLLTQCLALELAPRVRVNTIVPGMTLTDEARRRFGLDDPETRLAKESSIPMGRLGTPEDVADIAMLIISDEARFVTGQRIFVDGGQYMW